MMKWIPVSERKPNPRCDGGPFIAWDRDDGDGQDDNGWVLLANRKSGQMCIGDYCNDAKRWYEAENNQATLAVTHWMPLPEPPK